MPSSKRSCATRPKPTLVTATARPGPARARRIASVLASGSSPNSARAKSWAAEQLGMAVLREMSTPLVVWLVRLADGAACEHCCRTMCFLESSLRRGGALADTGWCEPLRSSEPPASVGLASRPVGAWRRQLVKHLHSTRAD